MLTKDYQGKHKDQTHGAAVFHSWLYKVNGIFLLIFSNEVGRARFNLATPTFAFATVAYSIHTITVKFIYLFIYLLYYF